MAFQLRFWVKTEGVWVVFSDGVLGLLGGHFGCYIGLDFVGFVELFFMADLGLGFGGCWKFSSEVRGSPLPDSGEGCWNNKEEREDIPCLRIFSQIKIGIVMDKYGPNLMDWTNMGPNCDQ